MPARIEVLSNFPPVCRAHADFTSADLKEAAEKVNRCLGACAIFASVEALFAVLVAKGVLKDEDLEAIKEATHM